MVASTHVFDCTDMPMRESRAHRFRHSMGMMGGQSSVTLHSVCELKYAGAQGMSYSSFMGMPQL